MVGTAFAVIEGVRNLRNVRANTLTWESIQMDRYQSTLRSIVKMSGIGLHSGREVRLEVCPADVDTGIVFLRTDSVSAEPVRCHPDNISNSELCTTIGFEGSKVSTIEHLMAAFAGLGIDNALVKVDAFEIPIMDGSASPFVDKFLQVGIQKQNGFRKLYVLKKTLEVSLGESVMRVEPARHTTINCEINFNSDVIGKQSMEFNFNRIGFMNLCDSRTFCHMRDVEAMRKVGLALGGTLDNAIVVTDDAVVNEGGLRSSDEFVKHKVLDCVGDLAILGAPLVGKISLNRPGHALHAKFMKELVSKFDEYVTVVEYEKAEEKRPAVTEFISSLAAASAVMN